MFACYSYPATTIFKSSCSPVEGLKELFRLDTFIDDYTLEFVSEFFKVLDCDWECGPMLLSPTAIVLL